MVLTIIVCSILLMINADMVINGFKAIGAVAGVVIGFVILGYLIAGTLQGIHELSDSIATEGVGPLWDGLLGVATLGIWIALPVLAWVGFLGLCKFFDRFLIQRGM